ncbi:MAG: DUF2752 domain-containing protein [Bacteroidetes bacterium]|nr:MAG: DUF2752 domain-containing protein [Bacteroidota bacterium]
MLKWLISWLEANTQTCPYIYFFGIECPGCGMQRALIELLKGNLVESIQYYPALIPLLFLFLMLIIHLVFKLKNGAEILKYIFLFNVLIILISYIVKLFINYY